MSRSAGLVDGPWVVVGVQTVDVGWFKEPKKTPETYPNCFWCGTDQTSSLALLISVKYQDGRSSGWFCESCARERNLIW